MLHRARAAAAVIVLGLGCIVGTAYAAPEDDLRDAENSYLYGDYPRVVRKLTPLVQPDILLANPDQLAVAYRLLGLAHFFLDQPDDARTHFERLIRLRPDTRLNPVLVPPPAVAFFDTIRDELADELARMEEAMRAQREAEEARRRAAMLARVKVDVQVNSRWVAVLPFGVGQFQNGDDTLGYIFLGTELATAGASLGLYWFIEGLRQPNGFFDRGDVERAESLQVAQQITGWIAIGLMVIGATEALVGFIDERPLRETTLPPPPGLEGELLPDALGNDGLLRWRF